MKTINYYNVTWKEVDEITDIFVDQFKKDWGYVLSDDFCIIALARGGLIPANIISHKLGIPQVHSLGLSYYENDKINNKRKLPIFYQGITTCLKENIIIIDDISDTGSTFLHTTNYLKMVCGKDTNEEDIHTFSLFTKFNSKFKPDYFGKKIVRDTWVIFPWEQTKIK
jgi:hypoxanthine phosphoribosyltransferase